MELKYEKKAIIKTLNIPLETGRCNIKMQLNYPYFENHSSISNFYNNMNDFFVNGIGKIISGNKFIKEEVTYNTGCESSFGRQARKNRITESKKRQQTRCNIYSLDVISSFEIKKYDKKIISLYTDYIITSEKIILLYKRIAHTWIMCEDIKSEEKKDKDFIMLDAKFIKDYYPESRKTNSNYDGFYIEETQDGDKIRYYKMTDLPIGPCRVKRKDYSSVFIEFI